MNTIPGLTKIEYTPIKNKNELVGVYKLTYFDLFSVYPIGLYLKKPPWIRNPSTRTKKGWKELFLPIAPELNDDILKVLLEVMDGKSIEPDLSTLNEEKITVKFYPYQGRNGLIGFADCQIADYYVIRSMEIFPEQINYPRVSLSKRFPAIQLSKKAKSILEVAFRKEIGIPDLQWEKFEDSLPLPVDVFQSKKKRRKKRHPLKIKDMADFDNKKIADAEWIVGVDEVGAGAIAGPIAAGAVAFPKVLFGNPPEELEGLTDSKLLSESKRSLIHKVIKEFVTWEVKMVEVPCINQLGYTKSVQAAQIQAINALSERLSGKIHILLDGSWKPSESIEIINIPDGDYLSMSIAAASIMAKVTRDLEMIRLSGSYPEYLWHKNKGYPTAEHYKAIEEYGFTPFHRNYAKNKKNDA